MVSPFFEIEIPFHLGLKRSLVKTEALIEDFRVDASSEH